KGTTTDAVLASSHRLLARAGAREGLLQWSEADLREVKGIGPVKAAQLAIVFEIARRVRTKDEVRSDIFKDATDVFAHLGFIAKSLTVEKFWVLCLNRKNRLIRQHEATSGTASSSLVHPREVFREAIRHGASAVICAHNHPSGDPAPSAADIKVTRQLREASAVLSIDLLDHVVLGNAASDPKGAGFYSFQESGLL